MTKEKTTATDASEATEVEEKKVIPKPDALKSGTIVMCDDEEECAVITRDEAIELGFNRYFTGLKCQNGHMAERKVKGYVCTICARIRAKARRKTRLAEDPDYKEKMAVKRREKHKARYAEDPEYKEKILVKAKERRLKAAQAKKDATPVSDMDKSESSAIIEAA